VPSSTRSCAALLDELSPERGFVDVVDERTLPVDLHDRQPFAIALLEHVVPLDVDLFEIEVHVVANTDDQVTRALAEVAASSVVQRDVRQGRIRNRTVARLGFASLGSVGHAASRSWYPPGASGALVGPRPVIPKLYEPGSTSRSRVRSPM
jgi:hypothetical protein